MLFHHSNDIAKLSQLNCSLIQLYRAEIGFIVAFSSHPHTQPPTQPASHPWKCISATIKQLKMNLAVKSSETWIGVDSATV